MPELVKINRRRVEVLKVDIEGKVYSIPLGTSLKRKELAKLDKQEEVLKFFEKHLTKAVVDDLTMADLKQIIEAWSKATQEASGVSLGK